MIRTLAVVAQPGIDLRPELKDTTEAEAALRLGAFLADPARAVGERVEVVVPWLAGVAWALRAAHRGHAGPWRVELLTEPEPATVTASSAWRELRLTVAAGEDERQAMLDPLQRLADTADALRKSKATVVEAAGGAVGPATPVTPATILQAIQLGENPAEIRARLGLSADEFSAWAKARVETLRDALAGATALAIGPRVRQAWAEWIPAAPLAEPAPTSEPKKAPISTRPTFELDTDNSDDDDQESE